MKNSTKWIIGGLSVLALGVGGWLIWRNAKKKKELQNVQQPQDPIQDGPFYETIDRDETDTNVNEEYHASEDADIHIDMETHNSTNYFEQPDEDIDIEISSNVDKDSIPAIVNALDLPKQSIDIDGTYQRSLHDCIMSTSSSDFSPENIGVSVCNSYGINLLNGNFTTAQKAVMCNLAGTVFSGDAYFQYKPKLNSWLQAVANM